MLFNSLNFCFFFVIVTIAYFQLAYKYRWILLLLASCYFYMSFVPVYLLIIAFTIIVDYIAGIKIEGSIGKWRRFYLILSLIANIGVLAVFKYYNFIDHLLGKFLHSNPFPALTILLPIGLSFHTFQAMSYTIEVYRGKQKAERNFGLYSLYVMFYPQLVAGPIERPQNLLAQFHLQYDYDHERLKSGLMRMAWGFFKKLVIADRLAMVVNYAYGHIPDQNGTTMLIATFFYTFQIYCDFSGYSDIAIGAAEIMGIKLMENFKSPYFSSSISEFWRRWHISLSTWFKDYLYIPLGGNRVKVSRMYFNLFIVFLISGLWHGANLTFVVWGAVHGFYLIFAIIKTKTLRGPQLKGTFAWLKKHTDILITFILVMMAWVFFRAVDLHHALSVLKKIVTISPHDKWQFMINYNELIFSFLLISLLLLKDKFLPQIPTRSTFATYSIIIVLAFTIYVFGVFDAKPFIYFQF